MTAAPSSQKPKRGRRIVIVDVPLQLGFGLVLGAVGLGTWFLAAASLGGLSGGSPRVIAGGIGVAAGLTLLGLLISHRVAGPLYAMIRQLAELAEGRLPARRGMRRFDFFQGQSELLQEAMARLRATAREEVARLEQAIEALSTHPGEQATAEAVRILERLRDQKTAALGRAHPASPTAPATLGQAGPVDRASPLGGGARR